MIRTWVELLENVRPRNAKHYLRALEASKTITMIVLWVVRMNREIDGLFDRGAQSEFVHVVLDSITEDISLIVRRVISEHGKGCVVKILDVDVKVSVLDLPKVVLKAHKELSIVCLSMVGLLAKRICPATASVTPITFPSFSSPWIT